MSKKLSEDVVFSLIKSFKSKPFSISQIHTMLNETNEDVGQPKSVRQFIYRKVKKLESSRRCEEVENTSGNKAKFYRWIPEEQENEKFETKNTMSVMDLKLKKMLKEYKLEMFALMGEAEVFAELCEDFPSISSNLRERYYKSKDESSKLLGKIRALESLLQFKVVTP